MTSTDVSRTEDSRPEDSCPEDSHPAISRQRRHLLGAALAGAGTMVLPPLTGWPRGAAHAAGAAGGTDATRPFRVTAIPDEAPTQLIRKFQPLGTYLAEVVGRPVEFTPTTDYAATVEALVSGKADMAWFGGFTFVQARHRSHDGVVPIIQRTEDQDFHSIFIAGAGTGVRTLADLKGHTFTFGSPASTSGHLMPRFHLVQAGVDPDRDLQRVAFSGAHDATVAAVAGGRVDAGALNISVWDRLVEEKRVDTTRVVPFFTTPGYADYNWSVRRDMPEELRARITQAMLKLDPANPRDRAILALQRTVRFVPTQPSNYQQIEDVARHSGLLKD